MASKPIFQFKAELIGAPVPTWREFQVLSDLTFSRLAYVLMTMFEMQASHLFSFELDMASCWKKGNVIDINYKEMVKSLEESNDRFIRVELPWDEDDLLSSTYKGVILDVFDTRVSRITTRPGFEMMFTYDFGDNWEVKVTIEDYFDDEETPGKEFPRVIAGEGYGILEDCGGVGGLKEIYKAFQKKKGEAYEEYREWLGVDDIDLKALDIDDINFRLKKLPRIYNDIYEYGIEPTERSLKILYRDYLK